jgi:hypothetical protein
MAKVSIEKRLCRTGDLPDVCLKCGQPATNRVKKTFSWVPPWVFVLILAGLVVWLIVDVIMRKRITAHLPLCDVHKGHWRNRMLLILLSLVGWLALLIGVSVLLYSTLPPNHPLHVLGFLLGFVGVVAWLFLVAIATQTAIRAVEIHDRYGLKLTGICQDFIDAYDEEWERDRPMSLDRAVLERWDERRASRRDREERGGDRYRGEDEDDDRRRSSRDRYREDY